MKKDYVYMFPEVLEKTGELTEADFKTLQYVILNAGFAGKGNIFNLNGFYEDIIEKTQLKKSAITKALKNWQKKEYSKNIISVIKRSILNVIKRSILPFSAPLGCKMGNSK